MLFFLYFRFFCTHFCTQILDPYRPLCYYFKGQSIPVCAKMHAIRDEVYATFKTEEL